MNKLRAEYLQAMGVDLYVHRSQLDSDQESSSVENAEEGRLEDKVEDRVEIRTDKAAESTGTKAKLEMPAEAVEVPGADVAEGSAPSVLTQEESSAVSESSSEESIVPAKIALPLAEPLYFLWHQVGELLFLTAASQQQSTEEAKLLGAIIGSLSRSEKLERGTGNWPLVGSEPTSQNEAQDFLASFVAGRGELCGSAMTLVLFGEESKNQFTEIKGDFEDILGSKIPSQSELKEYRLVPSLADMLNKPYIKSIAWQSLRDLRTS